MGEHIHLSCGIIYSRKTGFTRSQRHFKIGKLTLHIIKKKIDEHKRNGK